MGILLRAAFAQGIASSTEDLGSLSPADLLNLQVTSVARKSQRLAKAPAAVFVITEEDLHRAGVTTIAEALRMVPGLNVARMNGNTWAVSSRGFIQASNKMLVLVDGRSVYSPILSLVFWDIQDMILEDIDRIEVIRGPGAVMWGANAVNGVINIITKPVKSTQGALATVGSGTEDRGYGALRYGGSAGDRLQYRVYAKQNYRQTSDGETDTYRLSYDPRTPLASVGNLGRQDWRMLRSGFRTDWQRNSYDSITFQGDIYRSAAEQNTYRALPQPPFGRLMSGLDTPTGANLLTRWTRTKSPGKESSLQIYYDHSTAGAALTTYTNHIVDIDYQNRRGLTDNHELYWGGGFRSSGDSISNNSWYALRPDSRRYNVYSGVLRDEYQIVPDRLMLSAGVRLEHNDYTGFELQPDLRLLYTPSAKQSWWASWSRAVRTPSRVERDLEADVFTFVAGPIPILGHEVPSPGFVSERLLAHEIGYRRQSGQRWSIDLTAFYNRYTRLATWDAGTTALVAAAPPHIVMSFFPSNRGRAKSWGAEAWGTWRPLPRWKLVAGYTGFGMAVSPAPGAAFDSTVIERVDPRTQWQVRSQFNLSRSLQFDTAVYGAGLRQVASAVIDASTRVDVRLGWKVSRRYELSVAAHNLLNHSRLELFPIGIYLAQPVRRTLNIQWTTRF